MPPLTVRKLNNFLIGLYKNMTLFLFFILPSRVASVFVSLSIISLVYDVRKIDIKKQNINCDKFKTLLQVSFNEEIMLLPQYTLHWFWKEEFLENKITIEDKEVTIKEALKSDDILFNHLRLILECLLQNIPNSLKTKLKLNNSKEKLIFKHNVINLLIHA